MTVFESENFKSCIQTNFENDADSTGSDNAEK